MKPCSCGSFKPNPPYKNNECRNCSGIRPSSLQVKVRKPIKRSTSPKSAPQATFASRCRELGLTEQIIKSGVKRLRWCVPVEKGLCWEIVKKIVRKREKDCYTCTRKNLEAENAQAGHCYPVAQVGSNNTLSWDLRLIHLQCGYCNGAGQGEQGLYEERIKRDYGEAFLIEARQRRYKVDPIKNWTAKLDELVALLEK